MNILSSNFLPLILQVTMIVTLAIGANFLFHRVIMRVRQQAWLEKQLWGRAFFDIVAAPLHWMIWLAAGSSCIYAITAFFELAEWEKRAGQLRMLVWIGLITWLLLRWKSEVEKSYKERHVSSTTSSMEKASIDAVSRLLTFLIYLLSGLTSLKAVDFPIETFLTFGAVATAGIAWASTDIVKNFFGGFMIYLIRPFAVGDWINSPEKEIEGKVEEIGWYQTRIRSFDKRPIYVPNGLFPAIVMRNPSRMTNRRILADIGLRYDDVNRVRPIVKAVEAMLQAHPAIDPKQIIMVHFVRFGSHSLDLNVYCFTKTRDWKQWRTEQQEIFLEIAKIIELHGAEIAFPTQVLKFDDEPQFHEMAPQS